MTHLCTLTSMGPIFSGMWGPRFASRAPSGDPLLPPRASNRRRHPETCGYMRTGVPGRRRAAPHNIREKPKRNGDKAQSSQRQHDQTRSQQGREVLPGCPTPHTDLAGVSDAPCKGASTTSASGGSRWNVPASKAGNVLARKARGAPELHLTAVPA